MFEEKNAKKMPKKFKVKFQPTGKWGEISEGQTILEAARELGIELTSVCGGMKKCGKCRVTIEKGKNLSKIAMEETALLSETERRQSFRLACATKVRGDVVVFVPEERRPHTHAPRKTLREKPVDLNPGVAQYFMELSPPTLQDPLGDLERLKKTLTDKFNVRPDIAIDYRALLILSSALRQRNWKITVSIWMDQEIIDIKPGRVEPNYGLAIDLGTTTVVAYLCNLCDGTLIGTQSLTNPQGIYGEDVISRISYAMAHPGALEKLHRCLIDGLNQLAKSITQANGLCSDNIVEITVVGNTVIHHLFLKIDPRHLGVVPFTPTVHQSVNIKARDLGLKVHPSAYVHILPIEAGFVGADNVGVLIAEEPYRQKKPVLIIDIGTNGELVVGNRQKLLAASCATGPALEGASIKFGMRAIPGAIERIQINPQTLEVKFKVVGKDNWSTEMSYPGAKGICGSGIIDGIAELYRVGLVDKSGRLKREGYSPRLRIVDSMPEFVIAWMKETSLRKDITITQQDIRSIQLAKGALYAGAKLLMRRLGIEKVDRVILAGAFGSYIDPEKAMILGMFPDCDLKHVYAVGNAAGDGARMALLNRNKRVEAEKIANEVEYCELTLERDFQTEFINSMAIPHARDPFPHLKGIVRNDILNQ